MSILNNNDMIFSEDMINSVSEVIAASEKRRSEFYESYLQERHGVSTLDELKEKDFDLAAEAWHELERAWAEAKKIDPKTIVKSLKDVDEKPKKKDGTHSAEYKAITGKLKPKKMKTEENLNEADGQRRPDAPSDSEKKGGEKKLQKGIDKSIKTAYSLKVGQSIDTPAFATLPAEKLKVLGFAKLEDVYPEFKGTKGSDGIIVIAKNTKTGEITRPHPDNIKQAKPIKESVDLNEAKPTLSTDNQGHGFFGTAASFSREGRDPDVLWVSTFNGLRTVTRWRDEEIRYALDSPWGREFADHVLDYGAELGDDEIEDYIEMKDAHVKRMISSMDRQLKKHGIVEMTQQDYELISQLNEKGYVPRHKSLPPKVGTDIDFFIPPNGDKKSGIVKKVSGLTVIVMQTGQGDELTGGKWKIEDWREHARDTPATKA